jgi:ABC-type branched-subunit amino acid transport system substrate-binding protein
MLRTRTRLQGMLAVLLLLALAVVGGSARAHTRAAQPYTIGMTVDFTGIGGSNYAPLGEALRVYFANLNAKGGINNHPVKLIIRDNKDDPARLSSDFKYFNEQNVNLIYYSAFSSTLATYKQSANPNTPVIYGNSCYPPSTPPNPAKNFFCVGVSPIADAQAMVNALIKHFKAAGDIKLGDAPSDLPGTRFDAFKVINPYAQSRGASVVDTEVIPFSVTDLTPIAQKFMSKGANAIISFSAPSHVIGLADALKKIGWKGYFTGVSYSPGIMTTMAKIKSPTWYTLDWFALPTDNGTAMTQLRAAAKKYKAAYPPADLRWGWSGAMIIQRALEKCGWPCSQSQLSTELNNFTVNDSDWIGFYGSALQWTATTHTSPTKAWRFYRFNPATNSFQIDTNWFTGKDPGCGHVNFVKEKTLC